MKRILRPGLLATMIAAFPPCIHGSEAFFSPDGKTVTTCMTGRYVELGFRKIDIATGKSTLLPLPAALKDEEISSIARGADGEILFLAKDAVWVLKDGEAARKVVSTSPVKGAYDLFVGTKKGSATEDWLFVTGTTAEEPNGRGTFYARKPGGKQFDPIFCRRVEDATSGAFAADDRLFFVSSADLWMGDITANADDEGWRGVLVGDRLAPLAFKNTDEANGGGMFVSDVSPAGKWVYSALRGRHMAAIVRTPMPPKPAAQEEGTSLFQSVKESYAAQSQALSKTEIISEDLEDIWGFCATEANGKPLVFFYTRPEDPEKGAALMLWNGSGAPKVIGNLPKPKDE